LTPCSPFPISNREPARQKKDAVKLDCSGFSADVFAELLEKREPDMKTQTSAQERRGGRRRREFPRRPIGLLFVLLPLGVASLNPAALHCQTVSFTGVQTTVGSGLTFPAGVAVDGAGNVFIADSGNNRVVKVSGQWRCPGYGC
jgi:hypothetical protein